MAWSADLGGLPIERGQVAVLARFRGVIEAVGWEVEEAEPDLRGADECFRTLRAWQIATGPAGQLGDRLGEVKATIQDEVHRGRALTAQAIADASFHLGVLWRRAVEFFSRYDLLVAPVTQLAPFPVEWEYPTSVDDMEMSSYIEWMSTCIRITVLGTPALSLPAGFDEAGLPVGAQLIGRHGGDVDLLRAAAVLEAATDHRHRRPPVVEAAP